MAPHELLVLIAAGVVGGAVQSVLGFGAAIVTVPTLAIVEPELLPVSSQIAMLPLITTMAVRGRRHADLPAAGRMLLGRLPGVFVGTWLVLWFDTRTLTIFVAAILVVAVMSMARGWSIPITPRTQAGAGFTSAVTGTSTGLGGPPLALLYRRIVGDSMRATLATVFLGGVLMSLGALTLVGEVTARHLRVGAAMGAGTLAGLFAARGMLERASPRTLQRGVLIWATVGALVAAGRAFVA